MPYNEGPSREPKKEIMKKCENAACYNFRGSTSHQQARCLWSMPDAVTSRVSAGRSYRHESKGSQRLLRIAGSHLLPRHLRCYHRGCGHGTCVARSYPSRYILSLSVLAHHCAARVNLCDETWDFHAVTREARCHHTKLASHPNPDLPHECDNLAHKLHSGT